MGPDWAPFVVWDDPPHGGLQLKLATIPRKKWLVEAGIFEE